MIVKWLTAFAFTTAAAVDHLFRSAKVGKTLPAAKLIRIVCERVRKFNKLNCCRSCSEPAITISDTISNLHLFIHTAQFAHCSASARSICQSILKFATAKNWIKLFPMGDGAPYTFRCTDFSFRMQNAVAGCAVSHQPKWKKWKILFIPFAHRSQNAHSSFFFDEFCREIFLESFSANTFSALSQ